MDSGLHSHTIHTCTCLQGAPAGPNQADPRGSTPIVRWSRYQPPRAPPEPQARERDRAIGGGRPGPPDTGKGARRMEGCVLREGSEAIRIRSRTQGLHRPFAIPEFMSITRHTSEIENTGDGLRNDPGTLTNPRVAQTLRNPLTHVVETTHRENRNQGRYEESVPANWRPQGESNPRRRRERAVSWASRRWGRNPVRRPRPARISRRPPSVCVGLRRSGGARRDRTADLYNAIVALSQLSYGPGRREFSDRTACLSRRKSEPRPCARGMCAPGTRDPPRNVRGYRRRRLRPPAPG